MGEQLNPKMHYEWEVKTYEGIKTYNPSQGSVPSEVKSGIYEGGYQLWECTLDLLRFLEKHSFNGKTVFELGCGRGLPGIYCSLHGSSQVVLQDFNRDVIEEITMPNVLLNGCSPGSVSFSASSWTDIPSLFPPHSFDIVLASETIYRKEDLPSFVSAFRHLIKEDGVVIVAAKRMYFGLSGSVFDLIDNIKGEFTYELHEIKDQSAYRRDIITIRKQKQ